MIDGNFSEGVSKVEGKRGISRGFFNNKNGILEIPERAKKSTGNPGVFFKKVHILNMGRKERNFRNF